MHKLFCPGCLTVPSITHRFVAQHSHAAIEERFRAQMDADLDGRVGLGGVCRLPVQVRVLEEWSPVVVVVLLGLVLAPNAR